MTDTLEDYILSHITPEPDNLKRLSRKVYTSLLYTRMCSGQLQGRILAMLTAMVNPMRVLEIGTYAGYSALCLAEGLQKPGATVTTIEIDDEMADFINKALSQSAVGDRVHLIVGDAMDIIPTLPGGWDLIYLDANKRLYPDYFRIIADRVSPGGYIIADNTLWDGKVALPTDNPDPQTRGIIEFNDMVANDPRFQTVIIPLRDGLTIIRKI